MLINVFNRKKLTGLLSGIYLPISLLFVYLVSYLLPQMFRNTIHFKYQIMIWCKLSEKKSYDMYQIKRIFLFEWTA